MCKAEGVTTPMASRKDPAQVEEVEETFCRPTHQQRENDKGEAYVEAYTPTCISASPCPSFSTKKTLSRIGVTTEHQQKRTRASQNNLLTQISSESGASPNSNTSVLNSCVMSRASTEFSPACSSTPLEESHANLPMNIRPSSIIECEAASNSEQSEEKGCVRQIVATNESGAQCHSSTRSGTRQVDNSRTSTPTGGSWCFSLSMSTATASGPQSSSRSPAVSSGPSKPSIHAGTSRLIPASQMTCCNTAESNLSQLKTASQATRAGKGIQREAPVGNNEYPLSRSRYATDKLTPCISFFQTRTAQHILAGLSGVQAVYMLACFSLECALAGIISAFGFFCIIFTIMDTRPTSYLVCSLVVLTEALILMVSVSSKIYGFESVYEEKVLRRVSVAQVVVLHFTGLLAFVQAYQGFACHKFFERTTKKTFKHEARYQVPAIDGTAGKGHDGRRSADMGELSGRTF